MFHGVEEMDKYVLSIPDFPEPGIIFRDVTAVLKDPDGLNLAIKEFTKICEGLDFDAVVGLESRGFIFGTPVAYNLHKAFIPVRKAGKLPREVVRTKYALEYGEAEVEIHKEDIKPGMKVVIIDDLLATGGTMEAAAKLIEACGGIVVKMAVMIELEGLKGREYLSKYDLASIISYDGK